MNLEKNENIKKCNEKKSYSKPQLNDIGKVNSLTKGSSISWSVDSSTYMPMTS